MKIIGKTTGGFILVATENEVARLVGYYYSGETNCKIRELRSNDEINIDGMYEQLYALSSAKRRLVDAQKNLRSIADSLDTVSPIIPVAQK